VTYEKIVQRRRDFNIPGTGDKYKTLSEVDFDGPWVTPYQISSCSLTGPVLVAYHWFDVPSVNKHRQILKEKGYMPAITFNNVLERALEIVGKTRSDIYVTQAFHLLPSTRSASIEKEHLERSFDEITRHELDGRRVVALGDAVAGVCKRFGVKHQAVVHPSARRRFNEDKAMALAAAIKG
jgi:hypothetical protein